MEHKSCMAIEIDDFYEDRKKSAEESLIEFFRRKNLVVSRSMILSDYAISTVLNTDYDFGFDYAHRHLLSRVPCNPRYNEPSLRWQVHVLLKLLADMRSKGIPKIHHPGLTLLFFHFCEGFPIPDPPPLH